MLVLSRKRDEQIVIADNIVITVVEIRGDKVRLGVDAPKEIPVHRREVYEAIKRGEAEEAEKHGLVTGEGCEPPGSGMLIMASGKVVSLAEKRLPDVFVDPATHVRSEYIKRTVEQLDRDAVNAELARACDEGDDTQQ